MTDDELFIRKYMKDSQPIRWRSGPFNFTNLNAAMGEYILKHINTSKKSK